MNSATSTRKEGEDHNERTWWQAISQHFTYANTQK